MRYDSFASRLETAFSTWRDTKLFLERSVSVSTEFIHVIAGIVIFLVAAAILRRPVSSGRPWLAVLALALLNEVVDLTVEHWPQAAIQLGESVNDLLVTMLVPTLLLVTARKLPRIYGAVPTSAAGSSSPASDDV